MKFVELVIRGFMPYREEQRLQFPQDSTRNVMLVFGENMRGKTSVMNAIRWCLYGQALDRDRRSVPMHLIANMDAAADGDWSFAVYLRFEADGTSYDLRRTATPRDYVHTPRRDSDYDVDVQLTKNDLPVRADEIEHEINQLMPKQIARFFLFDAELLAEYEELLAEESDAGKKIKEAVEQVLGVPALTNGRDELKALLRKAQDVLAKENRHSAEMRAHSDHFAKIQGELDSYAADKERLLQKEATHRAELAALDASLAQTEGAQKLLVTVQALKLEDKRLEDREAELRQQRLEATAGAWREVLQPRLQAHIARLERARQTYQAEIERRGELKTRISQLKAVLGNSTCAVCEQPIAPGHRDRFGELLGGLEGELDAMESSLERVGQLTAEISSLNRIASSGSATRLRGIEAELNRTAVERTRIEGQLSDADAEMRKYDTAEIARQRSRRDQVVQQIGRLQGEIQLAQKEIDDREAKKDQLSRLMMRAPGARTMRSAKEVQVYSGLERIFALSVDRLRDQLRSAVQARATEAFLALTTEKTYSGLRINESYGLSILDRDNRIVSIRSAGAEQIVALSLIDGLNRTARKTGPIVIDTPLGRLDLRHRANVLQYLPTTAEQVVLLVHEGEIDRGKGIEFLSGRIGAVYEIQRISSSESRLVRA